MTKFEDDAKKNQALLEMVREDLSEVSANSDQKRERLNKLLEDIKGIAESQGIDIDLPAPLKAYGASDHLSEITLAISVLEEPERHELREEFSNSVPSFPPFDSFDIFVLTSLGGLALLAEFFLVGLPPGTKWTPKNEGGVVPVGWLSERIKSWQVDNNNWLATICKVPYDKVQGIPGMSGPNHRTLSFGHDPSPLGMVYGLMDIISGGMTGVTRDGQLFHIPGTPPTYSKMILGPLLWIGHLASDVATPMGLPVPGWSLTQLLRVPAWGAPGTETIADVARMMYEQGYDFRHYLAGGIVPALIEIVLRTYHFARYTYPLKRAEFSRHISNPVSADLAGRLIERSQVEGHLKAMLFWAHAFAAAVNAGKIAVQGITGNYPHAYFSAAKAINVAQWQVFAGRTVQYLIHRFRNKNLEQTVKNRQTLNKRWDELSGFPSVYADFACQEAPGLTVISGGKA
jgi:hypothetical protein